MESLDRPGEGPEERSRCGFGDAAVGVGADFVGHGRQIGRRVGAHDDHRFFVAAGAEAFDEVHSVEHVGFVADENGVEDFVAELSEAGGDTDRFFEHHLGRAVGGKGLGQPAARAMERRHVQHLDPSWHLAPDLRCVAGRRLGGFESGHSGAKCAEWGRGL